jgi:hypothetical protein
MRLDTLIPFVALRGGMGRTRAIAKVAERLVQLEQRVLVIDMDMTAPGVAVHAGALEDRPGVADFFASRKSSPLLVQDLVVETRRGYSYISAGTQTAVTRLLSGGIVRFNRDRMSNFLAGARAMNWDYVLVDLPPGNLALRWAGTRSLLWEHANAVCTFTYLGEEQRAFMTRLASSRNDRTASPPMMWVAALVPHGEESYTLSRIQSPETLAGHMMTLSRVTALEDPASHAWDDLKYLGDYRALAQFLYDWSSAAHVQRSPSGLQAMITGLERSLNIPPTILKSRVETYLHPRNLVLCGQKGSGKTALSDAAAPPGFQQWKPDPHQCLRQYKDQRHTDWIAYWQTWFQQLPSSPIRVVFDGFDEALGERLEWPAFLAAMEGLVRVSQWERDRRGVDLDVKILMLPGTAYALEIGKLVRGRQFRFLRWTKTDLLQMAMQRAVKAYPLLGDWLRLPGDHEGAERARLHKDWDRSQLEVVASSLFGFRGLEAWDQSLPGIASSECELVPREAAELLLLALQRKQQVSSEADPYVPPEVLSDEVRRYARRRYRTLLQGMRDWWYSEDSLLQLANGAQPDELVHPLIVVDLLNRGLLHWDDPDSPTLSVPPLVLGGLLRPSSH